MGLFWAVATAHQRNGYAAEAATALIGVAFTQWHVPPDLRHHHRVHEHRLDRGDAPARHACRPNPEPAPFFLQAVGILDNTGAAPSWPTA